MKKREGDWANMSLASLSLSLSKIPRPRWWWSVRLTLLQSGSGSDSIAVSLLLPSRDDDVGIQRHSTRRFGTRAMQRGERYSAEPHHLLGRRRSVELDKVSEKKNKKSLLNIYNISSSDALVSVSKSQSVYTHRADVVQEPVLSIPGGLTTQIPWTFKLFFKDETIKAVYTLLMNVAVSPLRRNLLPQIPREDPECRSSVSHSVHAGTYWHDPKLVLPSTNIVFIIFPRPVQQWA